MIQNFLYVDATPDENYPLRILQAYRRIGNSKWSSSSMEIDEDHPLIRAMNEAQEKRNALLDKAIEILATQPLCAVDFATTAAPKVTSCQCGLCNGTHTTLPQSH